jgi:5-oxoprolinase (ATP-hydrolysing)
VPVHLGAMGESVRTVLERRGSTLRPGDVVALNNPYNGGTHLPDVTVITPVFDTTGKEILFFVGSRGHHADIGGITPGSTPPASRTLEEEGVVIDDFLLVDQGHFREPEFRAVLAGAKYPARSPDVNVADIKAQVAANEKGVQELQRVVAQFGWGTVSAYMKHVMDNAEESVRQVLARIGNGSFDYVMDDGAPLKVRVTVDQAARTAVVDFTGTGPQRDNNFNAPPAVTRAAVLYVFRCLVGSDIPLNDGCLKPIEIRIPPGTFLSPYPGAAVVAGNTEVSQATCNALFGALGALACSQATMNNDQHAHDRPRGAGAALPGAAGAVRHPPRLRRRRQVARRRRFRAPYPLPGADDGGDRLLAPQRAALRARGRGRWCGRAAMGGAGRRRQGCPDRHRQGRAGPRRRVRDRDAGRRRLRRAAMSVRA